MRQPPRRITATRLHTALPVAVAVLPEEGLALALLLAAVALLLLLAVLATVRGGEQASRAAAGSAARIRM